MRSRYAAYALGKVGYLMRTQHPDGLADAVDTLAARKALQLFCQKSTFLGLAILNETTLSAIEATVTFQALLQQDGRDASFREKSLFRIKNGRWLHCASGANTHCK